MNTNHEYVYNGDFAQKFQLYYSQHYDFNHVNSFSTFSGCNALDTHGNVISEKIILEIDLMTSDIEFTFIIFSDIW